MEHFPNRELYFAEEETLPVNNWSIINCHIDDLEKKLKSLPGGRKQLAVARWQDQVTVIINEV